MLHKRLLILLGGSLLMVSAAWADDVGYVDCSNHGEETQVFGKPRRTHDVLASLPCGQRFTILLYGFIFSRIQTRDGKVGYIYSNLISLDHSGVPVQQQPAPVPQQQPAAAVAQQQPASAAQPQPAAAVPAPPSSVPGTVATPEQPNAAAAANQPEPPPAQEEVASAPASTSPASTPNAQEALATAAEPGPARAAVTSPATAAVTSPAVAAEPQPAPAEPAAPIIRPANARTSWERPNPAGHGVPRVEVFGGYAFARFVSGGTGTNLNGALGSFAWNFKPWLQLVADTSYSVVTVSGTKNVLYGNHFGPRVFFRGRNPWGMTPFVEGLVGGSRLDSTVSGTGGYSTSDNSFSIKAGGGVDVRLARRFEVRLFDVDYYRTSFGANVHQNNYWVSTGIVLRLFGGPSE
jgi:outer membrane biosynthesis protein TonB